MIADELQQLKKQVQQLLDSFPRPKTIELEAIPSNYNDIRQMAVLKELAEAHDDLRALLNSPHSTKEALQTDFLKLSLERDNFNQGSCLHYPAMAFEGANKLYWEAGLLLFKPKNLAAMLAIIMPTVTQLLTVDIYLDDATANNSKKISDAMQLRLQKPALTLLAHYPAKFELISKCVIHDGIIFPLAQITSLPFNLQQQLFVKLDKFPGIKAKLYTHNDDLKKLNLDIELIAQNGLTPKQMLSHFIRQLELAGIKYTGQTYAANSITLEVYRIQAYLEHLPKQLRKALKALTSGSDTLKVILGRLAQKGGHCVEQTADAIRKIHDHSAYQAILEQHPALSLKDVQKIKQVYGRKPLSAIGYDATLLLPAKWREEVIKKIKITSANDYIDLIINLPPASYQSLLQFAKITCTPPLPSELVSIKDMFTSEQVNAFVQAIVSCIEKMGNKYHVLKFVDQMGDQAAVNQLFPLLTPRKKLSFAVEKGNLTFVQTAITAKADVNKRFNGSQRTPLYYAVGGGFLDIVKYLVENGALLRYTDLLQAVTNNHVNVVNYLLEQNLKINEVDGSYETALYIAASRGYFDMTKYLLEHGADINKGCTLLGKTPLLKALLNGNTAVALLLLEHGANCHQGDLQNITPLKVAAQKHSFELVQRLIAGGADVNCIDRFGETPLRAAVERGDEMIVRLLLDSGAKLNHSNKQGETALFFAAKSNRHNIVRLLLTKSLKLTSTIILLTQNKKISQPIKSELRRYIKNQLTLKKYIDLLYQAFDSTTLPLPKWRIDFTYLTCMVTQQELREAHMQVFALLDNQYCQNRQAVKKRFKNLCLAREATNSHTYLSYSARPNGLCNQLYWHLAEYLFPIENLADMLAIVLPSLKEVLIVDVVLDKAVNHKSQRKTPVTESVRLSVRRARLTALSHYPADLEFLSQCLISDSVIFPLAQITALPLHLHQQLFDQLTHYPDIKTKLYVRNDEFKNVYADIRSLQTANATLHKLKKKYQYRISAIDSTVQLPSTWCTSIINEFTLGSTNDYIDFIRYLPPTEYRKFLANAHITCNPPIPFKLADFKYHFTQAQRSAFMQAVLSCIDKMGAKDKILEFAQRMGDQAAIQQILPLLHPDEQMLFAVKHADTTLATSLLATGAVTDVNHKTEKGKTYLTYAVKKGNLTICKLLFEHGADLTHVDDKHMTPLLWAVAKKQHAIIKWLVENGVPVDHFTMPSRNTGLMLALLLREITLIQLLLELGANVNHANTFGATPLIWAACLGEVKIIECLLGHGADINALHKGKTALHYNAMSRKDSAPQIVNFLLSKHAKITSKLLHNQHKIPPKIMSLLKSHSKTFTLKQAIQLILEAAHDSQQQRLTTVHEQLEMINQELATQDFAEEYQKCQMLLSNEIANDQALQTQFRALCLARDARNNDTCLSFTAMPASTCNKLYWKLAKLICKPKSLMEMLAVIMPSAKTVLILDVELNAAVNDKSKKHAGISANMCVKLRRSTLRVLARYPANMAYFNRCIISDGIIFPIAQITKLPFHLHQQLLLALNEYPTIKAKLHNYNDGFNQLTSLITSKSGANRAHTRPNARSPLSHRGSDLSLLPPVDQQIAMMNKINITSIDDYLKLITRLPTSLYQSLLSLAEITCVPPLPSDLGHLLMNVLPEQRQAFMQAVVSCIDKLGPKENLITLAGNLDNNVAVKQIVSLCSPERQLFFAIRENDVAQMNALLSAGHINDINQSSLDGFNYLTYAVSYATKLEVIKLLLEHGANIHQADQYDRTAIALATGMGDSQKLQYLLSDCVTVPTYFGSILLESRQPNNVLLLKNYINQHLSSNDTIQLLLAAAHIQIQSETKNVKISDQYNSLSQFRQHIALVEAHQQLTDLFNRVDLTTFAQQILLINLCATRAQSCSNSLSPCNRLYWYIAESLFKSTRLDEMLAIVMPSIKEALIIDIQLNAPVNKQWIKLGNIRDHMRVVVLRKKLSSLKYYAADITLLSQFIIGDGFIFPVAQMTKLPLRLHKQLYLQLEQYPGIRTRLYEHNLKFKVLLENISSTKPNPKFDNDIPPLRSVRHEKKTVLSAAERIKVMQHIKITSLADYHDILTNLAADQYQTLFEHAKITCPAAVLMQLSDLLCKIDKDRCTAFLRTLVHYIDKIGDKHIVLNLVDKLNNLELINTVLGLLPIPEQLAYALAKDNIALVMSVLEKEAGVEEFKNKDGLTPLMWAVRYHSLNVVLFLLAQGADINRVNRNGTTPLLVAAISGQAAMVRYLLENGAQINHKDKCGNTALIWAAKAGHVDVVKLLLCYGADINLADKRGRTAYDWAVKDQLQAVMDLLIIEKEFATLSQLGKVCHSIKSLGIFKQPKLSTGVNVSLGIQMQVKSRVG